MLQRVLNDTGKVRALKQTHAELSACFAMLRKQMLSERFAVSPLYLLTDFHKT